MDFDEWLERLQLLQQDLQVSCTGWVTCVTKTSNVLKDSTAANINSTGMTLSATYTTALSPLTEDEKTLLQIHFGCYKCHVFYVGHLGHNCTNPRPMLEDCRRVMAVHAAKAKAAYEKKKNTATPTPITLATIFDVDGVSEESDSNNDSEEFMDVNEIEEYVPPTLTFPEHLRWTCCVDAPATCASTPIEALIDHGSSPVLISSHLAKILCLTAKPLFKPLSVSGAFRKKNDSSSPIVLNQYCRLSIQSPDALWHSHVINAIICPELHTDLILGLDFLVKNRIVVDAHLRTAIAKESGYDLLNPPDPKLCRQSVKRSPAQHRKIKAQQIKSGQQNARKTRILVHMELMALFDENETRFGMELFTTSPPDLVATIKTQIE
ncbi:hypothetical protein L208DRAFT_1466856 [Tricholoma matsutake]|nr:hypothetical protein L208DRAFT_1466856 [Tricholoma matsutake 945]